MEDQSNGYEAIAAAFTRARRPSIGPRIVWKWAKRLPPGASVLDLGCAGPAFPSQKHCSTRLFFNRTSPRDACSWSDAMTGLPSSISLGHDAYAQELAAHGLQLVGNDEDEGQNYYSFAVKL